MTTQNLFSFGGLTILKRNQAHNDAGSYPISSVVLICGLLSTQWHAMDDAVLVHDNASADVVGDRRSADALCKAVQLNTK